MAENNVLYLLCISGKEEIFFNFKDWIQDFTIKSAANIQFVIIKRYHEIHNISEKCIMT